MPVASAFSHAIVGLSIGACFFRPDTPKRAWAAAVVCSVLPDIDVIGFRFGIRYGDFLGHRGFTHSLLFAGLVAAVIAFAAFPRGPKEIGPSVLFACLFLATASHGILDAMTNGGLGVAFFSPFDLARYFLPWRPILVSPIAPGRFFSARGYAVLQSEFLWVWIPAGIVAAVAVALRHNRVRNGAASS